MRTVKPKLSACRSITLHRANTPTGCVNAHPAWWSWALLFFFFLFNLDPKKPNNSCTCDDSFFFLQKCLHYTATGRVTQQIPFCLSPTVAGNQSNLVECFSCAQIKASGSSQIHRERANVRNTAAGWGYVRNEGCGQLQSTLMMSPRAKQKRTRKHTLDPAASRGRVTTNRGCRPDVLMLSASVLHTELKFSSLECKNMRPNQKKKNKERSGRSAAGQKCKIAPSVPKRSCGFRIFSAAVRVKSAFKGEVNG